MTGDGDDMATAEWLCHLQHGSFSYALTKADQESGNDSEQKTKALTFNGMAKSISAL